MQAFREKKNACRNCTRYLKHKIEKKKITSGSVFI